MSCVWRFLSSKRLFAFMTTCVAVAAGCGGADSETTRKPDGRLFVQLLRSGEPLAVVHLATGESRIVRDVRMAGGDPPFRLLRSGGRLVYYGPRGTYAIDLDLKGRPQRLGEAWYFIPSATDGRVWLTFLDPDSPETVRDLRSVAEVAVRGRVTVGPAARPPCRGPTVLAAAQDLLLCQDRSGLRAFDPASGEVLMRLPGPFPLDTHGRLVAWCAGGCPKVHITDLGSGRDTVIGPDERFRFQATYEGAFSPDGSLLATPVLTRGREPGSPRRQVGLIDVSDGTVRVIAGSRLSGYRNMTWSSSGRWLFFQAGRGRVMAYRRGSTGATLLPFDLNSQIIDMAAS